MAGVQYLAVGHVKQIVSSLSDLIPSFGSGFQDDLTAPPPSSSTGDTAESSKVDEKHVITLLSLGSQFETQAHLEGSLFYTQTSAAASSSSEKLQPEQNPLMPRRFKALHATIQTNPPDPVTGL